MDASDLGGVIAHYDRIFDEDSRLRRRSGELERVRTRELLGSFLPDPPARVLDVGGGTGIHSEWLASLGHDVTLLDVTPRHVELAAKRAAGSSSGFRAVLGDARRLEFPVGSFDVVLLLGPLYHLTVRDDRLAAIGEARESCGQEVS